MASLKTYLLAPNFYFHTDGPLQLGTIITNPFRPTKWTSKLTTEPERDTHVESDRSISKEASSTLYGKIFASFLQTASTSLSGEISKNIMDHYTMDTLETISYKRDPTDEEITQLVETDKKIQAAMNSGLFGSRPVYLVTGLRIAKGFRLTREVTTTTGGSVGANIPLTEEVSAGAEIGGSRGNTFTESLATKQDIVFAYQLHVIAQKGWIHKRFETDVFAPKAAFLSEEDESEADTFTSVETTMEDLEQAVSEYPNVDIEKSEVQDGSESCICIAFKELN